MALLIIQVELRVCQVQGGTTGVQVQQEMSDNPGQGGGTTILPITMPVDQFMFFQDAEPVPGTSGAITLANLNTALTNAVTALAGASGTPRITAANLATINAWNAGSP
jgi:hypothetical protein